MGKTMSNAIWAEDLHVRYRAKSGKWIEAVKGLSFQVHSGEVVGFLGPNGAGKSTTLKALMGFIEPHGGFCEIFGEPSGTQQSRTRVGYLPEVALYYPFLTPLETLTLYGELQGLSGKQLRAEALHLLEVVGLAEAATKKNKTLSKGMLQRVGIAQALLGEPELLILDEVTSGLDPVGRKELRHILKARRDAGCTLFFSSHELSEVEMLCDRIMLIHHGRFVEEREINELKAELRNFELTYHGHASLLDLTEEWSEAKPGECIARFHSKEALVEAIERVHRDGGRVLDVVAQEGSLEDYFVETIGRAA
jgi:ABC-2 type transport system ATP-binding protein